MYVTECSIGTTNMTPEVARDEVVSQRKESQGRNAIEQFRLVAGLCNSGEFDAATYSLPLHERKILGDATDQAILRFSESMGPVSELRQLWGKNFELAFNSKNKFMIRILSLLGKEGLNFALPSSEAANFTSDDMYVPDMVSRNLANRAHNRLLTIKGAPDILLSRCSRFVSIEGESMPLDNNNRLAIEQVKNQWSAQGKRVILLARKVLHGSMIRSQPTAGSFEKEITDHAKSGLTLVGLVGIVDPPRDEIPSVIRILRGAGIRIFMVSLVNI
jgi:sodium/potassium-transporting ATPase subunit alpha